MTLYHFGNCVTLLYVPHYLTYKYANLSEYGAFWKCIQGGIIYAFTQLCKMLILATFFPANEASITTLSLSNFFKSSVDLADIAGIYVILQSIPGKGHAKVMTAGIGWAGAEILLTRFLLLWVGARGTEFDWKYTQKCLESNINLMHHIMTAALVWLWSRHDLNKLQSKCSPFAAVSILLLLSVYRSVVIDSLAAWLLIDPWSIIAIKGLYTIILGSPEEYYRRVLYIPLIGKILEDLKTRFLGEETTTIFQLMKLIPCNTINMSTLKTNDLINAIIGHYSFLEINASILKGEVELWRSKWISNKNEGGKVPDDIMITIDECHPVLFPTIRKILFLLATLPVSIASAERSFSTLRRLKTWLRNQMGQQRLTSLALMNIHQDIIIDVNKIIDRFSKSKRNFDFVI